jgi:Mce-associated membrane protein
VAVPPTHDGSVGPRSTSGSPSASTVLTALTAVFAVVCVACLVVLGLRYGDTSGSVGDRVGQVFGAEEDEAAGGSDDTRTRETVLSQANQFIIRINTYGPKQLDKQSKMPGYVKSVKEVITPKLDVEFEKSVTLAEQSVAETGLERAVQLYASGAESITDDTATALVTGVVTQSYPDPKKEGRIEFEPELFRYEVTMVRTGGTWLADDFTPVRGEVAGEPTAGASADPSAPTTGDPSSGAASPSLQRYSRLVAGRRADIETAVAAVDACGFPDAAKAGATACTTASDSLAAAARELSGALRDAADPDAEGYVGKPPAEIDDLVQATRAVADDAVSAAGALRPTCLTSTSSACVSQRSAVSESAANLTTALGGWAGLG